ncbi:MAG TPA: hypothetical protein VGF71_16765 [Caulobacteraceae bacterium]
MGQHAFAGIFPPFRPKRNNSGRPAPGIAGGGSFFGGAHGLSRRVAVNELLKAFNKDQAGAADLCALKPFLAKKLEKLGAAQAVEAAGFTRAHGAGGGGVIIHNGLSGTLTASCRRPRTLPQPPGENLLDR